MAITNSDGSIVLTTKVDTGGIEKGMKKLAAGTGKFGKVASEAFGAAGAGAAGAAVLIGTVLVKATQRAIQEIEQLAQKTIEFSKEASAVAMEAEASVLRLIDIYGDASSAIGDFIDQNALALGMSKSAAASFASVYGNLFSVWADQATNAQLTNRYLQMTAVVASKTGRTVEDVQERIRSGLLGNTEAIEDLGIFVNVKTIEMTDAFQRMANGKSWEQLDAYAQQQIRSMAILEQATAKYGDEVASTSVLSRSRLNAAWQDFQATWGRAVNIILLPILNTVTDIINVATIGLQTLFGFSNAILGMAQGVTDEISNAVDEQEKLTDEVEKTAKAQRGALAAFDTVNVLGGASDSETGGGILGIGDISGNTNTITNTLSDFAARCEEILSPLKESFGGLFTELGETFQTTYDEVLVPFGEWLDTELAPSTVNEMSGSIDRLTAAFDGFNGELNEMLNVFVFPALQKAVAGMSGVFADILDTATQAGVEFTSVSDKILWLVDLLWGIVSPILKFIWDELVSVVNGLFGVFAGVAAVLYYFASLVTNVIGVIVEFFVSIFTGNWELFEAFMDNAIKSFLNMLLAFIKVVAHVVLAIVEFIVNAAEGIVNEIIGIVNSGLKAMGSKDRIDLVDWDVSSYVDLTADYVDIQDPFGFLTGRAIPASIANDVAPSFPHFEEEQGTGMPGAGMQSWGGQPATVVLEIDGRTFGQAVVDLGSSESRRIGTRMVTSNEYTYNR